MMNQFSCNTLTENAKKYFQRYFQVVEQMVSARPEEPFQSISQHFLFYLQTIAIAVDQLSQNILILTTDPVVENTAITASEVFLNINDKATQILPNCSNFLNSERDVELFGLQNSRLISELASHLIGQQTTNSTNRNYALAINTICKYLEKMITNTTKYGICVELSALLDDQLPQVKMVCQSTKKILTGWCNRKFDL